MTLQEYDAIFNLALSSESENGFAAAIQPLFQEYELLSLQFGRANMFWRARIIDDAPYENVDQLDYPPANSARTGRLNDEGSPCFYVSARKETALAEVGAKEGQLVQLAGFRVLNESPVRLVVIGEYANVQKSGYMHYAGRDPDMVIAKTLNTLPREEALKKIYIDKFFAHVLADPNASDINYRFSRALAREIYSRNTSDGIVFPSVRDRGGFNIGIKADASDRCYHNVSCIVVRMGKPRMFGLIDFEIINSAERLDEHGNFVWMSTRGPDTIGVYNLTKEEFEAGSRNPEDKNGLLEMLHVHTKSK